MKNDRSILNANEWRSYDFKETDQNQGVKPPAVCKPFPENGIVINLPRPENWEWQQSGDLSKLIRERVSVRKYLKDALSLEELSYLLWSTQGIREEINQATSKRFVPSAGSRHALETYLAVLNVEGVTPGMYRYLPKEHQLLFLYLPEEFSSMIVSSVKGQVFCSTANVVFYWSAIPYRMEWRYAVASTKLILLDAGHVCQNLYLTAGAIGCGTCAIAAYDQVEADKLCQLDGEEELIIYIAPVGKKNREL
ncbi:MAG: SagB/ThcOx family dehydrogenase [Candidatus Cloacimonetes bacterium]|nr:SagB/ThcOx family dehydrogenase [Candidatus Cloacimonadota bacterium]